MLPAAGTFGFRLFSLVAAAIAHFYCENFCFHGQWTLAQSPSNRGRLDLEGRSRACGFGLGCFRHAPIIAHAFIFGYGVFKVITFPLIPQSSFRYYSLVARRLLSTTPAAMAYRVRPAVL